MPRIRQVLVVAVCIVSISVYCSCLVSAQSTLGIATNGSSSSSSSSRSSGVHRHRVVSDFEYTSLARRTSTRCTDAHCDVTHVDTALLPDFWNVRMRTLHSLKRSCWFSHANDLSQAHGAVDPRIATNGAEPPEQLVKVTDRRHRHPVFATVCSIAFLLTIITIIIVCTQ